MIVAGAGVGVGPDDGVSDAGTISFPAHWGVGVGGVARGVGVPVPPPTDLLATISMFEQQIKSEPMG